MEVVHTCPDVRYWSEVLGCTIPTHMSDIEIKVINLEKIMLKFLVKVLEAKPDSGELCCPATVLIALDPSNSAIELWCITRYF